jgi:hypothetical protein
MANVKHPVSMTKDTLLSILFSLGIGFLTAVVLALFVLLISSQSHAEEAGASQTKQYPATSVTTRGRDSAIVKYGAGH